MPGPERAPKRKRLTSRADADAVITSLALPRVLHERARFAAIRLNWTFAELTRVALTDWLNAHSRGRS